MPSLLGGPGIPLPPNGNLFPAQLFNAPPSFNTNVFNLPTGGTVPIPAGTWLVFFTTAYSQLQWYDAVSTQWLPASGPQVGSGITRGSVVQSDGFNHRVANITGSAIAGTVTVAGTNYVQATTTITPSAGNSSWMPLVGGAVGAITVDVAGSNYSKVPIVLIDAPASPGLQATAQATLSTGTVSAITVSGFSAGAGYLTAPRVQIVPDPFDPNLNLIQPASAHCVLTGAGTLTAVLLQNFGTSQASGITLTVNGAGASATAATVPVSGSWVTQHADTIYMQRL